MRNKQVELIKYFISGSIARTAADLAGIHRNTAISFFHKLHYLIAIKQKEDTAQFSGEIDLDESYFGGHHKICLIAEQWVKLLSLVFLSEEVKSVSKSS